MTDDMGINPAITPASDVLVISHPYLPEGSLLLIDARALIINALRIPDLLLREECGSYPLARQQLDAFWPMIAKDRAAVMLVNTGPERVVHCVQCGKRRHASRRRCVKCKRMHGG